VQRKGTIQTLEDNRKERNTQLEHRIYGEGQLAKLLSYHPTTAVQLHMEGGKVVDGFHHLIFRSIVRNIIGWPFFLAFVLIDNDDEEEKEV
jgi:hypothetical protein